jgi:hypothetical protein
MIGLVCDVLDKQMVDRRLRKMSRVDGIILELGETGPPRVVAVETGIDTLARRLSERLGRWVAAWLRRIDPKRPGAYRVAWPKVRQLTLDVHVDVDAENTPVYAFERWLRDHIVIHMPFGRRGLGR